MNRRKIAIAIIVMLLGFSSSALAKRISTMDFVQVQNNLYDEARFYYQQNWLQLRINALSQGSIESYRILEIKQPTENFNFVLITTYKNQMQFDKSEDNFQTLIAQSGGLKLLNKAKPSTFRKVIFNQTAVED